RWSGWRSGWRPIDGYSRQPMRLDSASLAVLRSARIGMLSLAGARDPLVNPAAFFYGSDAVWMTTSRYAVKLLLARKDPRAAFLVQDGGHSILLQGSVEAFDPRSLGGQLRAMLEGPNFYMSLAGYALKNAPYVGGYIFDLAKIPRDWWPQNRVVLRLDVIRAWSGAAHLVEAVAKSDLPGVPAPHRRALNAVGPGYLCWTAAGYPAIVPALWTAHPDGALAVATV